MFKVNSFTWTMELTEERKQEIKDIIRNAIRNNDQLPPKYLQSAPNTQNGGCKGCGHVTVYYKTETDEEIQTETPTGGYHRLCRLCSMSNKRALWHAKTGELVCVCNEPNGKHWFAQCCRHKDCHHKYCDCHDCMSLHPRELSNDDLNVMYWAYDDNGNKILLYN